LIHDEFFLAIAYIEKANLVPNFDYTIGEVLALLGAICAGYK